MARQEGIISIKGTIDGMTYYNSKYGPLVRRKGGPTSSQVKNDPAFDRLRENSKEFGACSSATKLIRAVIRPLLLKASDYKVTGRLNKLMFAIKNLDSTSIRGERNVGTGIVTPAAKKLMKGFDFNEQAPLRIVLRKAFNVDSVTGVISVPGLIPELDLHYPKGATHTKIKGAWLSVDFGASGSEAIFTNEVVLPLDETPSNVILTPVSLPAGTGTDIFVLQLLFFQEVNGTYYELKNGEHNSMGIVEVV